MTPIAATLARANERIPYFGAAYGRPPEGWSRASDVVADPAAISDLLDQVSSLYQITDRQVAASFLVLGYFWYPMLGAVACYLLDSRVPNLAADAVAFRLGEGVRFLSPDCAGLADDPEAAHPHLDIVPDRAALRDRLVRPFEEAHAAPLFASLRAVAPYGIVAMRANYIDRLVSAILYAAESLGDWNLARREVPAFVARMQARSRAGLIEVAHAGREQPFQRRAGCCLTYRIPGSEMCDTCSLHPMDERLRLFRQYMEAARPTYV